MRRSVALGIVVCLLTVTGLAQSQKPGPPVARNPANGATNVSVPDVFLQWTAARATSYDLSIGTTNPPPLYATNVQHRSDINGAAWTYKAQAGKTYYWRVVAKNRRGSTTGSVWTFTTAGVPPPPQEICGNGIDDDGDGQIDEGCAPTTCQDPSATNFGGPLPCTYPPPPPPPSGTVWGIVDPSTLGTCSAAVHDAYVLDGGDGYQYRTWHPQHDPSGCDFGHEHGDNPASIQHSEIAARPILFGYIGRRMPTADEPAGHQEAHEGFKVFVANPGDVNDEGRVNRVYSRSVFHMGTGGPKRFSVQHHSADIALIHPEFGLKAFTRLMMDTGGVHTVCDPRFPAPTKDVMSLGSPCKLNSAYEIWGTVRSVQHGGREIYRSFATPAVFDPITVFNPANPTEVVYAWDPRVSTIKNFNDDWSYFRGCRRESYAQPGYWSNAGGSTEVYTDAMGMEVSPNDPLAIQQVISASNSVGAPATNDGLVQFKLRKYYCGAGLGLKN